MGPTLSHNARMALQMRREWQPLDAAAIGKLPAQVGVYEIADAKQTLLIACAGGRSLFGLRGELERELRERGAGFRFRWETTSTYLSRRDELLMLCLGDSGRLPPDNPPRPGLQPIGGR
jgi:hypothetical protein